MKLTVSVVLCTYNGAGFLRPLLESLVGQSARIDELVVADDGSTDETLTLVDAFAARIAPRVVIERRTAALGAAQNFSHALAQTGSDIVLPCDQDDIWFNGKVAAVVDWVSRSPDLAMLQHDGDLVDQTGRPFQDTLYRRLGVRPSVGAALFLRLLRRNLAPGCTLAVRRELLQRALPVPSGFMHDEWLALFGAALGQFRQFEDRLIAYRLHPGNALGLRGVGAAAVVASVGTNVLAARAAKIERLQVLRQRLLESEVAPLPRCMTLLEEALAHLSARQDLPVPINRRLLTVFQEWRSGRYRRHASGSVSAMRDLLGI